MASNKAGSLYASGSAEYALPEIDASLLPPSRPPPVAEGRRRCHSSMRAARAEAEG